MTSIRPKPSFDIPTVEQDRYLREWFEFCTILRCSPPARSFLARRGQKFFRELAEALFAGEALADILNQRYELVFDDAGDGEYLQGTPHDGDPSALTDDFMDDDGEIDDAIGTESPVNSSRSSAPSFLRERPWMLFETHMCVPGPTGRKPYKDLLMALAAQIPDNTEKRVSCVISYIKRCYQSVVRSWIAREANEIRNSDGWIIRRTVSETTARDPGDESSSGSVYDQISRIGREGGQPIGLHAIEIHDYLPAELPDPVETAQRSQLLAMAADIADDVKPALAHALRVALAARFFGVSLAHPDVVKFAKRGHTQLSVYLQSPEPGQELPVKSNLPTLINLHIRNRFPGLEPGAIPALRATVLQFLIEDNDHWLHQPENAALHRFLQAEEQKTL